MTPIPLAARAGMVLRSFTLQASFNYRTLIGAGFAFTLLPALRAIHGDRPDRLRDAVQRHQETFNSHPYLAGIAAGAVARLEADGAPPEVVQRFKGALRGPLGALGDNLFWAGWRPVCVLIALIATATGAPWALVAGGFLLIYNAGHLAARVAAFATGLRHGPDVGARLRRLPLPAVQRGMARTGALLLGFAVPLIVTGGLVGAPRPPVWMAAAAVAALAGLRWQAAVRRAAVLALAVATLGAILWGALA
jgi:PTS system mannose-specific IID component